jgi:alpha-glucosidase/alpha-D-xyloside xylohydrolase
MLPYLYSAVRESTQIGLPIMRAMWLHYPNDKQAASIGNQYLWGRDILISPVFKKGAMVRTVYLPAGTWYDWWTNEKIAGGKWIERAVDLATMPLYVRAGAVIPMGPLKQFTDEAPADQSGDLLSLVVYPGASGVSTLYEDDGHTFDHRQGAWTRLGMEWHDDAGVLRLRLARGSRTQRPALRRFETRLAGSSRVVPHLFKGDTMVLRVRG